MGVIPTRYRLQVVSPDDVVFETMEMGGFDMERKDCQEAVATYIRTIMEMEITGQEPKRPLWYDDYTETDEVNDPINSLEHKLAAKLQEAEAKAWAALAVYKFQMFGYWASIWVHLNKMQDRPSPNPFRAVIEVAREHIRAGGD